MYSDTPSPPVFRLTQSIPFSAASSTFPSVITVLRVKPALFIAVGGAYLRGSFARVGTVGELLLEELQRQAADVVYYYVVEVREELLRKIEEELLAVLEVHRRLRKRAEIVDYLLAQGAVGGGAESGALRRECRHCGEEHHQQGEVRHGRKHGHFR